MELTDDLKIIFTETAEQLQGWSRRTFMAKAVNLLGKGGQRRAESELGWCRDIIRKGQQEQGCSVLKNSDIIEDIIEVHTIAKEFKTDILNLVFA